MKLGVALAGVLLAGTAYAQVDENAMFGGTPPPGQIADAGSGSADAGAAAVDAGASPASGEDAIFDAPKSAPAAAQPAPTPTSGTPQEAPGKTLEQQSEDEVLSGREPKSTEEVSPDDPLKMGGTLYLRGQLGAYDSTPPKSWGWDMPNLLDVYLDARPNSRVRALAVGRLTYDPTVDPTVKTFTGVPLSQTNTLLDQLWINFDVARTVFVTAGKQHVKWGTSHFWNPTDFLQPVRLNPLDLFDERTGVTMIKAHAPWEATGWNFYGFAVFQGTTVTDTVQQIGGAARAEIVLGPAELGLDTFVQHGQKPKFGVDISSGVGPLDLYAEGGFHGADGPHYAYNPPATGAPAGNLEDLIEVQRLSGVQPQISGGGTWQVNLNERDALTLDLEGFYNALGYDDPHAYPILIFTGAYTPFYVGKYYGALSALVQLPRGQVVNAFNFSTIGNLSDESFISRLDYNVTVLSHLGLDLYGDVHYGTAGGEFRFGFNPASVPVGTGEVPQVLVPTPLFDAGVALRVSI